MTTPIDSVRYSFSNTTSLDTHRLRWLFESATAPWPMDGLTVRVRWSRGADFSGSCYYQTGRIFVNLSRRLTYPYSMSTYIGKTVSRGQNWWKPLYTIELTDGYQVALFVLMHEFYHWLVKRARRNTRQKESMCDRFAARALVDGCGAIVRRPDGAIADRAEWDFQNLNAFVAGAMRRRHPSATIEKAARGAEVHVASEQPGRGPDAMSHDADAQGLLFAL
jgi:hypothetical protein